ncbi:MAG: ATP-binding protein [Lactobacillaceae bacterium]|jgi:energy-coupling factor transporter ATP-binding protein EcfA2|nr:ATP-binding protein [Lactobacillaceae bacterium]
MLNPFTITFGVTPQLFLGRDTAIENLKSAFDDPYSPYRIALLMGVRGSGKTSLLNDITKIAEQQNKWLIVKVGVDDELQSNIITFLEKKVNELNNKVAIDSTNIKIFNANLTLKKPNPDLSIPGFQAHFNLLMAELKEHGYSVIFAVDEVQNTQQVRQLATAFQIVLNDHQNIMLLMAGLPQALSDLMNEKVLTFLWRAWRIETDSLDLDEIKATYAQILYKQTDDQLHELARATKGYPYLFQLIGYYAYKVQNGEEQLSDRQITDAIIKAKAQLFQNVHDIAFREMSEKELEYLLAMREDEIMSNTADIAKRNDWTTNVASGYANRLKAMGLIKSVIRGRVAYALPFTAEYLDKFILQEW